MDRRFLTWSHLMRRLLLGLSLLAGAVSPAAAQSVAGMWDAGMATPGGSSAFKLLFRVKGDTVSGTVYRSSGEVPLAGIIRGDTLQFGYTISYNEQPFVLTMTVRVLGDSMTGTVDFDGKAQEQFWAKRQKAAKSPPSP